jgi:hypothetical protein
MPFPYKPRSGRVINGDEPELSSGREIRRRGCNRLHHHGATWQMITGHTKKGKVLIFITASTLLCILNISITTCALVKLQQCNNPMQATS